VHDLKCPRGRASKLVAPTPAVGLVLLRGLLRLYGVFLTMTVRAGALKVSPFGGPNLAILYVVALIVMAWLSVIYLVLAGRAQDS